MGRLTTSLAFLVVVGSLAGCGPNLGDVPFLCNPGTPRCPDGYECKGKFCVKEGTCPDTIPDCNSAATCGNGTCDPGEDTTSCPADCKTPTTCGNGKCDTGENSTNCPKDCPAPTCGDGKCETPETAASCPADCYSSTCGNGKCDAGETTANCPADCPAACGNGKCDLGETNATCPKDCPIATCGNGKCDTGETPTSCPADCGGGCTADQTQCDGTDRMKYCESGVFKTDTCENLCKAGGYDYGAGCAYSSAKGKDVCGCGKYAAFGAVCDDVAKCDPALFCGVFGTGTKGFCTKYCTNSGGKCSGGPSGTYPTCTLQVSGKDACGFECDFLTLCPTALKCDSISGLCKP